MGKGFHMHLAWAHRQCEGRCDSLGVCEYIHYVALVCLSKKKIATYPIRGFLESFVEAHLLKEAECAKG